MLWTLSWMTIYHLTRELFGQTTRTIQHLALMTGGFLTLSHMCLKTPHFFFVRGNSDHSRVDMCVSVGSVQYPLGDYKERWVGREVKR